MKFKDPRGTTASLVVEAESQLLLVVLRDFMILIPAKYLQMVLIQRNCY